MKTSCTCQYQNQTVGNQRKSGSAGRAWTTLGKAARTLKTSRSRLRLYNLVISRNRSEIWRFQEI